MEEFKSNSNASKETKNLAPSKVQPITTNVKVTSPNDKKPFRKFFAEDAKTVGGHIVESVIVPSLQKLLSDSVKGAIDWLIYGAKGSSAPRTGAGNVIYSSYYRQPVLQNNQYSPIGAPQNRPSVYAVNDVMFYDRGEAEAVLQRMNEWLARYGSVAVADFYDLVGQRCSYTDQKYGWYDLRAAQILRVNDGYSIQFPRVQPIEN